MATNAQLLTRIAVLEAWKTATATKIAALEARPIGGTTDLTALTTRIAVLEAKVCPQQAVLDDMAAKLAVLVPDHVPTVG
jgi:BMFP domain-containing protein YqiC